MKLVTLTDEQYDFLLFKCIQIPLITMDVLDDDPHPMWYDCEKALKSHEVR